MRARLFATTATSQPLSQVPATSIVRARSDRIVVAGKAPPRPGRDGTRFNMTGTCTGSRLVALPNASQSVAKSACGNRHCYQFLPSA
jgi:hypothetical protein